MEIPSAPAATPATPTPVARSSSSWAWVMLLIVLTGTAVFALYYVFGIQSAQNQQITKQQATLVKRIRTLETALAAAQLDTVKTNELERLMAQLQTSQNEVIELKTRLETIEKTATAPAPKLEIQEAPGPDAKGITPFLKLKSAVLAGESFEAEWKDVAVFPDVAARVEGLKDLAEKGVGSEETLRNELNHFLEEHPAPEATVEDPKLARVNSTLKGLLHIAKKNDATDPYHILRVAAANHASIDVLIASVDLLPEHAKAPLAEWLATAKKRQEAAGLLTAAEISLAKPAE